MKVAKKAKKKAPRGKSTERKKLPSFMELFDAIKSDAPSRKLMATLTPLLEKLMRHGPEKLTREEAAFFGVAGAAFLTTLHERSVLASERASWAIERAAGSVARLVYVLEKRSIVDGTEGKYAAYVKEKQAELEAAAKDGAKAATDTDSAEVKS